jgi:dipeptidyl aminopeptidase/acylaminoacyl peptidase
LKRAGRNLFPLLGILVVFLIAAVSASVARAQSGAIDSILSVHQYKEVAISPNGKFVASIESQRPGSGVSVVSSSILYVTGLEDAASQPRVVSLGPSSSYSACCAAWSPDSKRIAFLATSGTESQRQLYIFDLESGTIRKLTTLHGYLTNPQWSPKGNAIAFLFAEGAPSATGPLGPVILETGSIGEKNYEQRIATVDFASGQSRQISPPELFVYEYDWSPDGASFVATAAKGSGTNNWWSAELYTFSLETGEARTILKSPLQIALPRWSPDGNTIAFIGGIMSDQDFTGGDIFTIPTTGGKPRNRTLNRKASATWLEWRPSSDQILFAEIAEGLSGIATVDIGSGKITALWSGSETISTGTWNLALSIAADGQFSAVIRSSYGCPPEIYAGPIGSWMQLTHVNANVRPSWGEAKSIRWTSAVKAIQGWLLYPKDYAPGKKYPLVVTAHGGPASASLSSWPDSTDTGAVLSSAGYFVLYPNYRGSFGQGENFTAANVKDYGYGDFQDIVAGVDEVLKSLPVDTNRVGILGWSYGGYLAMWAVTQSRKFHAAVAVAGISNWQSYFGQCVTQESMIPYFGGTPYEDAVMYARSSPVTFVKNAKDPVLLIVGERDGEVPATQSYEFWRGLKWFGIETHLEIYPGEGHLILDPDHIRDITNRTVSWFNEYLRP